MGEICGGSSAGGMAEVLLSPASAAAVGGEGSDAAVVCNEALDCLRKERPGDGDRRAKKDGSRLRRLLRLSKTLDGGDGLETGCCWSSESEGGPAR